jgi:hypothetical protein
LGFDMYLGHVVDLEIGAFYEIQPLTLNTAGSQAQNIKWTVNEIRVPVLAKFWLNDRTFAGAGAYYGKFVGSVDLRSCLAGDNSICAGNSVDYATAGLKTSDYGFVAAAGGKAPIDGEDGPLWWVVDLRYYRSLSNQVADAQAFGADRFSASDFQLFAGLRVGF